MVIKQLYPHSGLLLRSLLAELVGSLLLVVVGCGSCMGGDQAEPASQLDDQARKMIKHLNTIL